MSKRSRKIAVATEETFLAWLEKACPGDEFTYALESERRSCVLMRTVRVAFEAGDVALFRRRLNGDLALVARFLSPKARDFLNGGKRPEREVYPLSGRGLSQPTLPDGFDGPASRRVQPHYLEDPEDGSS